MQSLTEHRVRRRTSFMLDEIVLDVARQSDVAITAYAITRQLARRGEQVAPQQAYRSLARLQRQGRVRRTED